MTTLPDYLIFQSPSSGSHVSTFRTIFFPPVNPTTVTPRYGMQNTATQYYELEYFEVAVPKRREGRGRGSTSDNLNLNDNDNLTYISNRVMQQPSAQQPAQQPLTQAPRSNNPTNTNHPDHPIHQGWIVMNNLGEIQGMEDNPIPYENDIKPIYAIYRKKRILQPLGSAGDGNGNDGNRQLQYALIEPRDGLQNFSVNCFANGIIQILRHTQPFITSYLGLERKKLNCQFQLPYKRTDRDNSVICALRNLIVSGLPIQQQQQQGQQGRGGQQGQQQVIQAQSWFGPKDTDIPHDNTTKNALAANFRQKYSSAPNNDNSLMLHYLVEVLRSDRDAGQGQADPTEFFNLINNRINPADFNAMTNFMRIGMNQHLKHFSTEHEWNSLDQHQNGGFSINSNASISIQSGIPQGLRTEVERNCPECNEPNAPVQVTKKFIYNQLPNIFHVNISRFNFDLATRQVQKSNANMNIEEEILILPEYQDGLTTPLDMSFPVRYLLYGVASHIGTGASGGHYVSHVRNLDNQWHRFDDTRVASSSYERATRTEGETPYVLFYMREN